MLDVQPNQCNQSSVEHLPRSSCFQYSCIVSHPSFIDPALAFQLETLLQTHLTLGTQWMHDLSNAINLSKWPSQIPWPKKKQKADDSGPSPTHEVIEDLELDDQHAKFLDTPNHQEEDEVEKLIGKVVECCEEFTIDCSNAQEDLTALFC